MQCIRLELPNVSSFSQVFQVCSPLCKLCMQYVAFDISSTLMFLNLLLYAHKTSRCSNYFVNVSTQIDCAGMLAKTMLTTVVCSQFDLIFILKTSFCRNKHQISLNCNTALPQLNLYPLNRGENGKLGNSPTIFSVST